MSDKGVAMWALGLFSMLCVVFEGGLRGTRYASKVEVLLPTERWVAGCGAVVLGGTKVVVASTAPRPRGVLADVGTVIAVSANVLMAVTRVPVLVDPVTRCRVHLLRWSEWIALSFLAVYLIESLNHDPKALVLGLNQGASCAAALLLPFARDAWTWAVLFAVAASSFGVVYVRLVVHNRRLAAMKRALGAERRVGMMRALSMATAEDEASRAVVAHRLNIACATFWTLLVFVFVAEWVLKATGADSRDRKAWPFVATTVLDVLSKLVIAKTIAEARCWRDDADEAATDVAIAELRAVLGSLWVTPRDAVGISTFDDDDDDAQGGRCRTVFSRQLIRILGNGDPQRAEPTMDDLVPPPLADFLLEVLGRRRTTMIREEEEEDQGSVVQVEFTSNEEEDAVYVPGALRRLGRDKRLVELITKAWAVGRGKGRGLVTHAVSEDPEEGRQLEVMVRHVPDDRVLILVVQSSAFSDVDEIKHKYASELRARKLERAGLDFWKHELKNSVLDALGFCDSLATATEEVVLQIGNDDEEEDEIIKEERASSDRSRGLVIDIQENVSQLQTKLHETIAAMRDEEFARNVTSGTYQPKADVVDLGDVLSVGGRGNRFRLELPDDNALPRVVLDAMLLRTIHGNAVSNAAKYGLSRGPVTTYAAVDDGVLTVQVVNLPGENHVALHHEDPAAIANKIFAPGVRLDNAASRRESESSFGLGGWIMTECARLLRGTCAIRFEQDRTVFELVCPVCVKNSPPPSSKKKKKNNKKKGDLHSASWSVPRDCWGVGIDDSAVQRKMLCKIFELAGIRRDRVVVSGRTREEIDAFVETTVEHVRSHPSDKYVILADEHIELPAPPASDTSGSTAGSGSSSTSGSRLLQRVSAALGPELESNILTVVRSAAQSDDQAVVFRQRAHGLMSKEPPSRRDVLGVLQPLWEHRFPQTTPRLSCFSADPTKDHARPDPPHHHPRSPNRLSGLLAKFSRQRHDAPPTTTTTTSPAPSPHASSSSSWRATTTTVGGTISSKSAYW